MASQINASNTGFGGIVSTGDSSGQLQLQTAGTTAVTVDASQNVGIGTTSPKNNPGYTTLTLNNASNGGVVELVYNGTTVAQLYNDSAGVYLQSQSAKNIQLISGGASYISAYTNGAERMRIDSSGKVLIGTTTTPGVGEGNLSVESAITIGYQPAPSVYYGRISNYNGNTSITANGDSASMFFGTTSVGGTTATERMRINSSGQLLINSTSVAVSGYKLNIEYSGNGGSGGLYFNDTDGGLSGYEAVYFRKDGSQRGYIRVTTGGTTYNTVSDYRLKENIIPMTGALDKVAQLNPVTYTWKENGFDGQGFIAHELQAVVPDCVSGDKDAVDNEGNPVYQGIDTSFLVATLTAAIKELKAIVDAQQQEINALKEAK